LGHQGNPRPLSALQTPFGTLRMPSVRTESPLHFAQRLLSIYRCKWIMLSAVPPIPAFLITIPSVTAMLVLVDRGSLSCFSSLFYNKQILVPARKHESQFSCLAAVSGRTSGEDQDKVFYNVLQPFRSQHFPRLDPNQQEITIFFRLQAARSNCKSWYDRGYRIGVICTYKMPSPGFSLAVICGNSSGGVQCDHPHHVKLSSQE